MNLPLFQVDAFAREPFEGNAAAVVPLIRWLPEPLMQSIAMENHLAETAFFVREGDHYAIRWFTPLVEVALCGHATIAAAHIIHKHLADSRQPISFTSASGPLSVSVEHGRYVLDFPTMPPEPTENPQVAKALGVPVSELWQARDWIAMVESAAVLAHILPDFNALRQLDRQGVIVTAPGEGETDFGCRYFAPKAGVPEDPVTGSAYCMLGPLWASKLGKRSLFARQLSRRGGDVWVKLDADRVKISGHAVDYMKGEIRL